MINRIALWALCVFVACSGPDGSPDAGRAGGAGRANGPLFASLPSSHTAVRFENRLSDTRELNVFTYRNYYNGGGVALGDLNGDGLPELMLTANLGEHRLYLNQGAFRFRDVTREAGIGRKGAWATGVTFADVNGDGRLDIYICYAGKVEPERRGNELYVHQGLNGNGVPVFTEMATAYGIADQGYGTHSAFFDYDRDGDLDLYLVNNSPRPMATLGTENLRQVRDPHGGDKLLRNDGGRFEDVSEKAGIFGSEIGFGLGVAVGDVNRDGWPDLYVSNDFFERDYLYLNRQDGTFAEVLDQEMPYLSLSSMGLDLADIDNDALPDLYVTDMLPEDNYRLKLTAAFETWDAYQDRVKNGYHHQFTRNMLHRNNGDGTFSEIGQLAGVGRTDWSWSALIADFDLDGHKDIHVTNGIPRDVTSRDYLSFLSNSETMRAAVRGKRVDFLLLVEAMTTTPLPNYAFRNNGDLTFTDVSAVWGLNPPGFSNGAAYGDLDGDGALDLVVNNLNAEASVYRNQVQTTLGNGYLQIVLEGEGPNRFGIGAAVTLRSGDRTFFQELMPSRGFQSSVDYVLTFGIGRIDTVESVTVEWPDGRVSVLERVPANQRLTVKQALSTTSNAERPEPNAEPRTRSAERGAPPPLFTDVTDRVGLDHLHRENAFDDFDREPLMPKLVSTEGPFLAVADVNGDGLDDVFIGGAKDQAGRLFLQQPNGRFAGAQSAVFEEDRVSEDLGAVFFDADGDRDVDLYVVSGGSEFSASAPGLQDRLYLNDGRGRFRKAEGHLPSEYASGSRAAPADFDHDGDLDLFVGGRVVPWAYGLDPPSLLLQNDGRGRFTDVTAQVAPDLARIGMVTDALWTDLDGDRRPELVVVGEWMPITIFRNTGAGRLERLHPPGLEKSHGWWNRVVAADVTGDGRTDLVVGNLGLNTRFHATAAEPLTMHVKDFDGNGFVEQIVSLYEGGTSYPLALRDDLAQVLPDLVTRFAAVEDYARATMTDLVPLRDLAGAVEKRAHTLATSLVRNKGDGSFTLVPLALEAQIAPVYGIAVGDVDRNGAADVILAGNFDGLKPEIGRASASYGLVLRGDGRGNFTPVTGSQSGFVVRGQARDIQRVRTRRGELYVVTRNNGRPLVFLVNRPGVREVASER